MPCAVVPARAASLLLLLLLNPCASSRVPRHQLQPQQPSSLYDVEVREVDAATLRQILAGQGGGQAGQGHFPPQRNPNPNFNGNRFPPPGPPPRGGGGGGAGAGATAEQPKAHFVSPSGQVYTLRDMNGVPVLVGPDGRWFPLNSNNNSMQPHNNNNDDDQDHAEAEPDGHDEKGTRGNQDQGGGRGPPRRPPGPSGPNDGDDDNDAPSYDAGGGPKGTRDAEDCAVDSETTFGGGKRACRYQLLLDERFDVLNLTLWKHDVLLPEEPDFEFVAYDKDPDNCYVDKSILYIKPTLLEDSYGAGFVMNGTLSLQGCTSRNKEQCTRSASTYRVLPAVLSARLTTRDTFKFRYGIVEVRALVPEGDWIYPAITLEPSSGMYGKWYAGGQIRFPYAVGNRFLAKRPGGSKTGLQVMRAGVALGKKATQDIQSTLLEKEVRASNGSNWRRKHFRVYRVKWTPEFIEFSLDGKVIYTVRPPPNGFVAMTENPADHPWQTGSKMAPFDQDFFISIAVGVGGVNRFPDGGVNGEYNEHPKPWKNSSPKALLDFYKARDHWAPTWTHPTLEVAHVKVWAL